MPYFIWDESPTCSGWAVVKEDGEAIACHKDKQSAIEQMVAVSVAEGIEPGGTYTPQVGNTGNDRAEASELEVGQYVRWIADNEVVIGEIYAINGDRLEVKLYDEEDGVFYETELIVIVDAARVEVVENLPTNEPEIEDDIEDETAAVRQVNLTPPAYMRAAARQGLRYHEEGLSGDGLAPTTVREARAMAEGNVTADKWVRIRAWIARHLDDLDAPDAQVGADGYPTPGVVAHLLWGSGPSKRAARRALAYAEGVVSRIEAENEGRAKGEALSKVETRTNATEFEVREEGDGMTFSGYAALFDSPSEPLPFIERIKPGAFRKSLRSRNDIKFLWNHDAGEILGSTRAKTLKLYEDERGLRVEGTLPNTSRGRDVAELLKRGDVDSMSFGFSVPAGGDSWNEDGSERTLKSVRLHEVSLVAWPAYTATSGTVAVRGIDKLAERANVDADALADALLKLEDGQEISTDDRNLLEKVIDELAPKADEPKGDIGMLALKKKKLELLMKGI